MTTEQGSRRRSRLGRFVSGVRRLSCLGCARDDANESNATTNIAGARTHTTEENRYRQQGSIAIEVTNSKHLDSEETAERASSKRLSSYDNIPNSDNCQQQPSTRIGVVPSLGREEKKSEMVPIQTDFEHSYKKQKEPPEEYYGRKSKDEPTQKRVEHVERIYRKEKVLVISQETSKGYERRKYENMPPQKQKDSVIEGMKTENEPDEKKPNLDYMKPEDSTVDQEPTGEYNGKRRKDAPTQKHVEHVEYNYRKEKDSMIEGMKRENEPDVKKPNLDYVKPEETHLGNCQGTTHVQASTTSAAQPLNEVNSASSTNPEAKLQHEEPHTQVTRVHKQNHHHFVQQSFSQEYVPSPRAQELRLPKLSDKRSENTLCLYIPTFRENSSGKRQDIVPAVIDCGWMPEIPAKNVQASTTSAGQPLNEVNSASSTNPEAKLQHSHSPTQGMSVPKQNHEPLLMSQHCIQRSFSQELVPSPSAKPSDKRSENTLSLNLLTFREDFSGIQQDFVSSVVNCGSMPDISAKNKELAENNFCLAKTANGVSETNDRTPSYESLHDLSIDANQQRSIINISYPKPSVDLSIGQNSGGRSHNVDSIVNNIGTRSTLLNTVYDSKAAHSESANEEENKKTVYDIHTENDENCCTVEQQPAIISSNINTIEVLDQGKDEFFIVTQTGCELRKNVSEEFKEVVEKLDTDFRSENSCAMTNSLVAETGEIYVISAAKTNESISNAGDENRNWLLDGQANNFTDDWRTVDSEDMGITITDEKVDWKDLTDDWRTVDSGDMGITITDEKVDWKDAVCDDSCDWKNAAFGDTEWKEAIIEDWKTGYLGETDETSDRMFEDQQNEFEAATNDNMKLAYTEMPNEFNINQIGHMAADVLSASTVENRLNEVNGPPDSRTESHQEHYSHSNSVFGRNVEKIEKSFEDPQNLEHPAGQPRFTFETKCNIDIDSGRPAEDIPIGKELDISTAEWNSPRAFRRVGDNQDGADFVEGHQSEDVGQDIAGVRENTNEPEIEKVNEMARRKKSIDTPKKTGYQLLDTGPAIDQEEMQVPSPLAAVEQVPREKDSPATANEKKNVIAKRNKCKDAPEEISKAKRLNARRTCRPIVGLQNLGNTCFFNAVMQNINQSSLLYDLLEEQEFDRLPLTKAMVRFYRMVSGSSSTVTPSEVLHNVCRRSPRFGGGRQQDSHELLRHLLDGLRNEERESLGDPNNRKTLTKVDKVFGGHFMTVYTCKTCKTPYHVCEPLLDMSLPIAFDDLQNDEESSINEEDDEMTGDNVQYQKLAKSMMTPLAIKQKKDAQDNHNEYVLDAEVPQPPKKQKKRRNRKAKVQHSERKKSRREGRSILDCLDAFTRTEHIADEYLCMACHEKRAKKGATDYQMTSAKKRTLIYNPPALLTLHLKRFEQSAYGFVKCNDEISFQDMIDIGPYCSSWCMRNEEKETSIWYSLYGLVVHGGSLDGGHYVAYVKLRETEDDIRRFIQESYLDRDQLTEEKLTEIMEKEMQYRVKPNETEKWQPKPVTGTWFYISDSHCSQVQEEDVWRHQAYLLFYERREGKKSICYKRTTGNTETSV